MTKAAKLAGVADVTAKRYYEQFAARGYPRGTPARRQIAWRLPVYTGPEWIGKAIDTESRI